jgi:SAM-dependent methyltransferase
MNPETVEKENPPWYKQWFDENYLVLYRHRNRRDAEEQVRLIIDTLNLHVEDTILDLACGEGRYTALFNDLGYCVTGVDLSETLVNCGKERYPGLELEVGDMRRIHGKYDVILSLFTSFGYFDSDQENENVLRSVFNALNPGGAFWLDFLNAQQVEETLIPENITDLSAGIRVVESRKIENGRIIKDIYFSNHEEEKHYRESVRLFTSSHLEQMFQRTGFHITQRFGDYHGRSWEPHSPRTILVGRKSK